MYSQETINWESLKSSVDEMFPVRSPTVSKPNPAQMTDWETIERNARLRNPKTVPRAQILSRGDRLGSEPLWIRP